MENEIPEIERLVLGRGEDGALERVVLLLRESALVHDLPALPRVRVVRARAVYRALVSVDGAADLRRAHTRPVVRPDFHPDG